MDSHQLVNQTSGVTEWYTDPRVTAAACEALDGIDLDVASSFGANSVIQANVYYAAPPFKVVAWIDTMVNGKLVKLPVREYLDRGGLDKRWYGAVWMNCPFSIPEKSCGRNCKKIICSKRGWHTAARLPGTGDWIAKLVESYESGDVKRAITLNFAATSEVWFQPLMQYPQCFPSPRLQFFTPQWEKVSGATKGTALTYLGFPHKLRKFARSFEQFGEIKVHWTWVI